MAPPIHARACGCAAGSPGKRLSIRRGPSPCAVVFLSFAWVLTVCPVQADSVWFSVFHLPPSPVSLSLRSDWSHPTAWQVFSADGALTALTWSAVSSNLSLPTNAPVDWQDLRAIPASPQARYYTLGSAADDDGDGLLSGAERLIHHTDWQVRDSDADGYGDGEEIQHAVDPNDPASPRKPKSMRVDFGLYYPSASYGGSTEGVVGLIVSNAVSWGVDTIYAKAFSYEYGTFWANPTNAHLFHESGHGANDVLRKFIVQAHLNGIRVVAWVQPATAFAGAWQANPDWRLKSRDGSDFEPGRRLLSPFNTNVVRWTGRTIHEILGLGVDGLDVAETDYGTWGTNATYDAAANAAYFQKHPAGSLGDANWRQLRRDTLTTNVYGQIGGWTRAQGKEFHVT